MKIASSQVNMSNDHRSEWASATKTTVVGAPTTDSTSVEISDEAAQQLALQARRNAREQGNPEQQSANQTLVLAAGSEQMSVQKQINSQTNADGSISLDESVYVDKSLSVMKMVLEKMTGKPIDMFNAQDFTQKMMNAKNAEGTPPPFRMPAEAAQGEGGEPPPPQWVQISSYEYESQSNYLEFSGTIEQEDGTSTSFQMNVGFSQEYERLSTQVVQQEQLKDPLVISFSTKPVSLSDQKFQFDIDSDSEKDNIAMLDKGFGFLALDKNGDNIINDGSELFGAQSGNGFADLAAYDDNQDGYIDENDAVFDQLSVWVKNQDEDKLVSLKDSGIGAIATENVDSPMNIRSSDGEEKLGVIQKSGYYLNEDGTPGLVQQVDFVV